MSVSQITCRAQALSAGLVALHDAKFVFDFCGGMMFQLVLSDDLRAHLSDIAHGKGSEPVVYGAQVDRMGKMQGYKRCAAADNVSVFHGREVRQVETAAGGMGFVLHLSLANGVDAEGWTQQEIAEYDGWGHDSSRRWRKAPQLQKEGFSHFASKFGTSAYTLHHRFYFHTDGRGRLWLAAEDGCEGVGPVLHQG